LLSSFSGDKRTAVDLLTYRSSFSHSSTVHWGTSSKLGFSPTVPWSRLQSESDWLVLYYVCELWPTLQRGTVLQIWDMPVSMCVILFFMYKIIYPFLIRHIYGRHETYSYWLKVPKQY